MADMSAMSAMSMSTMGAHERQVWETLEAVGEVAWFLLLLQFYLFLPLLVHERTDKHTCEYRLYIIELEFWIRNFILKRAGLIVQLSFCHVYLESKKFHYKDWREEILTEIVEIWLAAKFEDIKRGKLLKLCVLLWICGKVKSPEGEQEKCGFYNIHANV